MARKVLVSFLGTNNYIPVYYAWGDKAKKATTHRTKYIQEAIATRLCKGWGNDDCVMVFRTEASNSKNWLDINDKEGLKSVLESLPNRKFAINPEEKPGEDSYIIPVGFSQEEIWGIFNCVFSKLKEGDEIYFDITHAFRSIPMFANVLFNYSRYLKHTVLKGVYYGAFEKLGSFKDVNEASDEEKEKLVAPIVDMTDMVRLQELNSAAASFRDSGNLRAFSELLNKTGIRELDDVVDEIADALANLDLYIQTCMIEEIERGEYMKILTDEVNEFSESIYTNEAQNNLLHGILEELKKYGFKDDKSYLNVEAAIKWTINHKMIQQAYTMAKEYVVTRILKLIKEADLEDKIIADYDKIDSSNKSENKVLKIRDAISNFLNSIYWNEKYQKYGLRKGWRESKALKQFINEYPFIYNLAMPYKEINNRRNNLNHAGTTFSKSSSLEEYVKEFKSNWSKCKDILG